MSDIHNICDALLSHLSRLNRPVLDLLQPPLTEAAILRKSESLPVTLTDSIVDLYTWRNGTLQGSAPFNNMWFFPGYFFMSLDSAIRSYDMLTQPVTPWDRYDFPVFSSGGGDFWGVRCDKLQITDGEVCEYLAGDTAPVPMFVSCEAMITTLLKCFEDEAFFISDDGIFDIDDALFEEIIGGSNKTEDE